MTSGTEANIREKLKRSGYTLTSQRKAVLEALKDAEGHPSAEDVYLLVKKNNPRVALGTVYQALSVLEEIGLIKSKNWSESPTRYDMNTDPHLDIRCCRCGGVDEIPGVELGNLEAQLQENTPYEIRSTTVVIEGVCPPCQKKD